MKTKVILITLLFAAAKIIAQNQNTPPGNEIDYSGSQIGGFSCIAIGASAIGLTAASKTNPPKNPNAFYIGGGALVATGICLLIFGDKEKNEPHYWKGMGTSSIRDRKKYYSFCDGR